MDELEIKKKIRPLLPIGFIDKIRDRLIARGVPKSRSWISEVLNIDKPAYDDDIITEALDLAAEQKKKRDKQAAKLELL